MSSPPVAGAVGSCGKRNIVVLGGGVSPIFIVSFFQKDYVSRPLALLSSSCPEGRRGPQTFQSFGCYSYSSMRHQLARAETVKIK